LCFTGIADDILFAKAAACVHFDDGAPDLNI
jgi:hypothetical protein